MNQTQASRLLQLAWFLRTEVKPKHFDMTSYAEKVLEKIAAEHGWVYAE